MEPIAASATGIRRKFPAGKLLNRACSVAAITVVHLRSRRSACGGLWVSATAAPAAAARLTPTEDFPRGKYAAGRQLHESRQHSSLPWAFDDASSRCCYGTSRSVDTGRPAELSCRKVLEPSAPTTAITVKHRECAATCRRWPAHWRCRSARSVSKADADGRPSARRVRCSPRAT